MSAPSKCACPVPPCLAPSSQVTVVIIDLASNTKEERNTEAPSSSNVVGSPGSMLGGSGPVSTGTCTPVAGSSPPTSSTNETFRPEGHA
eukprot:1156227-Pelagomonas_calceolata.AAC.12